jgi:hypothetical protein
MGITVVFGWTEAWLRNLVPEPFVEFLDARELDERRFRVRSDVYFMAFCVFV